MNVNEDKHERVIEIELEYKGLSHVIDSNDLYLDILVTTFFITANDDEVRKIKPESVMGNG